MLVRNSRMSGIFLSSHLMRVVMKMASAIPTCTSPTNNSIYKANRRAIVFQKPQYICTTV